MILRARLLSAPHGSPGVLLAAMIFALGFGVGATLGPGMMSRSVPAPSQSPASTTLARPHALATRAVHSAEVLRVIDGDTFEARVNLWPGLDVTTRIRLRGIDAPELKARCTDERVKAEAAREALRSILDQGEVGITHVTLDKYGGRVVADASTATTPDVSSAMLNAGHARRYGGGHRDGWCGN